MKPIFQRLTTHPEEGFVFKEVHGPGFDCPWHFHAEYEAILVLDSRGYRVVGDNISPLAAGDLVVVGPGLPHIWESHSPAQGPSHPVHALLIQFEVAFLGETFLRQPAFETVRRFLAHTTRGIQVVGRTRDEVQAMMQEMPALDPLARIIQLLRILHRLALSDECQTLATPGFAADLRPYDQERMNHIYQHLSARLDQPLPLSDVARLVHMSDGAFSRFFRLHTGKTFPVFLNELRTSKACRLLTESDLSVTEIAFQCGFNSLSNFNRQFLRFKRTTPSHYRRLMKAHLHLTVATPRGSGAAGAAAR